MANGLFNLKQVMQAVQQGGWPAQKTPAIEYLIVSGGGGGVRGGGGAGGLLVGLDPVPNGQTILVTVGAGGTGRAISGTTPGGIGGSSVFGSISPVGGGGGATDSNTTPYQINSVGQPGGSGGGGPSVGTAGIYIGGQGTAGQGNAGGSNNQQYGTPYPSGGGGGAGTVGLNAASSGTVSGNGGAGLASSISGTVTIYAGGGGGGNYDGTGNAGAGGIGGGGAGSTSGSGTAGTANTGGGGGGGVAGANGGNGGSGIVIVSYPDVYAAPTATTGSPTVSTSGSGSISFNGSNQYLNYAAQTPFAFGTGDFTIEFWAYPTGGLAAGPSYIDFRGSSVANPAPVIYNDAGTVTYYAAGSNRITYSYATLNTWVHIAVCRTGTSTKMYVNGTQVGATYTDANSYTVGTGGPYIGQNGTSVGYFTGYMSNIRVVKGVCVYTGTFTPPTAPLTTTQSAGTNIAAITGTSTSLLLNSASGAYLADSSTNSYVATATGSPTWNASSPFTGTGYKNRVYTWTSSGSITF